MRIYFKFIGILFSGIVFAQNDITPTGRLKNLEPSSAPAFVLMDVTPSTIIVPENIQAFSIQTVSAFIGDSSQGFGTGNYAVEFQPYWYFKRENMNFFKYNNFKTRVPNKQKLTADDFTCYNVFGDVWKKTSFSMALMNSTFEVFEVPQSYISIGAKTRLLSVRSKRQIADIKRQYSTYQDLMSSSEVIAIFGNPRINAAEKNAAITNLESYQTAVSDFEAIVERKPLFALDVAAAYSHFMGDKSQDINPAFGRMGIWAIGDLTLDGLQLGPKNQVHIFGIFRYLRDGLQLNALGDLQTTNAVDYGSKISFEFGQLSFGYEYITRDIEADNEERSMGSIRYTINDAFSIHGGFGKNFKSDGAAVVLFGIQWGLDFGSSVSLDPNK